MQSSSAKTKNTKEEKPKDSERMEKPYQGKAGALWKSTTFRENHRTTTPSLSNAELQRPKTQHHVDTHTRAGFCYGWIIGNIEGANPGFFQSSTSATGYRTVGRRGICPQRPVRACRDEQDEPAANQVNKKRFERAL